MITFEKVNYTYPDGTQVLHDITFNIEEGKKVGLIGANGAGKSTIMKASLGLVQASGRIGIGGYEMNKSNLASIRKITGYVLQDSDNQMFMPTVIDDMMFGPMNYGQSREEAEKAADEALARLGIEELKYRHNHKISGGEKRMAAIATVLAMKPSAMLLDEPSSSLDPANRRKLINILNQLDITMMIASHDLDMILDICSEVILINDGRVSATGPASEILHDRKLLESSSLELPFRLQK